MLNTAVKAARAAGAIINRAALDVESVRVSKKMENDFVTEVDQASENAIIETLLTAYPSHGILAEESGRTHGNPHAEHIWIIDPLDGTTNFLHGFPQFAVSIGLFYRGKIERGVVYDPIKQELFTAARGQGATLNNRRLRVTKQNGMSGALLGTGIPFKDQSYLDAYLGMLKDLLKDAAIGCNQAAQGEHIMRAKREGEFATGFGSRRTQVKTGPVQIAETVIHQC